MSSIAIKHARNGALAGIGLYLIVAIILLALSMGYGTTPAQASSDGASAATLKQIGQALAVALQR